MTTLIQSPNIQLLLAPSRAYLGEKWADAAKPSSRVAQLLNDSFVFRFVDLGNPDNNGFRIDGKGSDVARLLVLSKLGNLLGSHPLPALELAASISIETRTV